MTQNEILVQQTISTFQAQIDLLENYLHSVIVQHETEAQLTELGNCNGILLECFKEDINEIRQKIDQLIKLTQKIKEKALHGGLPLLHFVKYNLLVKEILDTYYGFFNKKLINELTIICASLYKKIEMMSSTKDSKKDAEYIILEALKHELKVLFETGLQVNAFSESEFSAFDLGDITPQESETVLIFLSTMKKWEPVYKRLAAV